MSVTTSNGNGVGRRRGLTTLLFSRNAASPWRRRVRVQAPWYVAWSVCLSVGASAWAGEITRFEMATQGGGYRLQAQGLIEAPRDAVWQVLTDYAGLHRVSPRIVESELVAVSSDGIARVRTLNRLCFLAFCRNLRHLQLIRELAYGDFESYSVPAGSDLSRGYARWRLHDLGATTRLDIDFRFAMESYSWAPPFVTRFVAGAALKADAEALIAGIERAVRRPGNSPHGD